MTEERAERGVDGEIDLSLLLTRPTRGGRDVDHARDPANAPRGVTTRRTEDGTATESHLTIGPDPGLKTASISTAVDTETAETVTAQGQESAHATTDVHVLHPPRGEEGPAMTRQAVK